jgi:hypothetical protein
MNPRRKPVTTTAKPDRAAAQPRRPGQRRPRRRWPYYTAGLVIALIAGVAVGKHEAGKGTDARTTPTPRPITSAPAATTANPSPTATSSATLPRGPASVGQGGTSAIYGIPIGYQHTELGGIEAATNYAVALTSPARFDGASRNALNSAILLHPTDSELAGTPQGIAAIDKQFGINDAGQALNADGSVNPDLRLYANLYPQWGAYRLQAAAPDQVTVQIWAPLVAGVGSDDDQRALHISWTDTTVVVSWASGDWKLSATPPTAQSGAVPQPANAATPSVSFAERARLLPGWMLYSDATEAAWQFPGQVLS